MKKIIVILLYCYIVILAGCYAQGLTQIPDEIQVQKDPYLWDFGQVKQGLILKHDFVLKNETAKTLTIKDANTSCGCTVSKVKKKILLPSEETTIEVQFNSKEYLGPTQQFIYVNTDSLDNPIIRYIIKAEVVK